MGAALSDSSVQMSPKVVRDPRRLSTVEALQQWDATEVCTAHRKLHTAECKDQRVDWHTMFAVLEECEFERNQKENRLKRNAFHPACHGFAMLQAGTSSQGCHPVFSGYDASVTIEEMEAKERSEFLEARRGAELEDSECILLFNKKAQLERAFQKRGGKKEEDEAHLTKYRMELAEIEKRFEALQQERLRPRAEKILEQRKCALREAEKLFERAKSELRHKMLELEEARRVAGSKASKLPHRGLILVAETEMKSAKSDADLKEANVQKTMHEVKQAEENARREAKYVSLFWCLSDKFLLTVEVVQLVVSLCICCGAAINKKLSLIFDLFSEDIRFLEENAFTNALVTCARVLESLSPESERVYNEDALRSWATRQYETKMTRFEFADAMKQLVSASESLCEAFLVPWRFAHLSTWQRSNMSKIRKFQVGLSSLKDLNRETASLWITNRRKLNPAHKLTIHERALAMGANDPLKPTYSKFAKKKRRKMRSNSVPLAHGRLGNIVHFLDQERQHAATVLQAQWRASVHKRKAKFELERRTFFCAWKDAKMEAAGKACREITSRDNKENGSVGKLKWDATIRMRQVKLRATGKVLNREEVVGLLIQEQISEAQAHVNDHFLNMKEKRGFKSDEEIFQEKEQGLNQSKADAAVEEDRVFDDRVLNVQKKSEADRLREERLRQKRIRRDAERKFVQKTLLKKAGYDPEIPESFQVSNQVQEEDENIKEHTELTPSELPSLRLPDPPLDGKVRESLMLFGIEVDDVYGLGLSETEAERLIDLQNPDPETSTLLKRLVAIGETVTKTKMSEFLQEIPSKRLIRRFLFRFKHSPKDALEKELVEHFCFLPRGIDHVVRGLRAFVSQDLEVKCLDRHVETIFNAIESGGDALRSKRLFKFSDMNQDADVLRRTVKDEHGHLNQLCETLRNKMTEANLLGEQLQLHKLQAFLEQTDDGRPRSKFVTLGRVSAIKPEISAKCTREASLRVSQAMSSMLSNSTNFPASQPEDGEAIWRLSWDRLAAEMDWKGFGMSKNVHTIPAEKAIGSWYENLGHTKLLNSSHRFEWMERYAILDALPSTTHEEKFQKFSALHDLAQEFLRCACSYGRVIISERFLPLSMKSIIPCWRRDADVGRGDSRFYFRAGNIHFKFASDEDGLCNGKDEFAGKYYAHAIRNSIAFCKQKASLKTNVLVPFEALIEFNGTRLFASAHAMIDRIEFDQKGNMMRSKPELVLGTIDRGKTLVSENTALENQLQEIAKRLNLSIHMVKGERDLLPKTICTPADLAVYKVGNGFVAMNFRRLMPPEDPSLTVHLPRSPRDHSIFWRQLRPELVKNYQSSPLSSNAFSMFCLDAPGWEDEIAAVSWATKELLMQEIPKYADELADRDLDDVASTEFVREMHARGINVRHLGLLRSKFWRKVRGSVRVACSERALFGTHDLTKEIRRGCFIRMRNQKFRVSIDRNDPFDTDAKLICIGEDSGVPAFSSPAEDLYTGYVSSETNSGPVRDWLLVEIVSRSLKSISRYIMRQLSARYASHCEGVTAKTLAFVLNMLSGWSSGSDSFWREDVVQDICWRFGCISLSEEEKLGLRKRLKSDGRLIPAIVKKLLSSFNARLHSLAEARLSSIDGFFFTESDIDARNGGLTLSHNVYLLEYWRGFVLGAKAEQVLDLTYEAVIMKNKPTAYWPLGERVGVRVAVNRGSTGLKISGKIHSCILGEPGFVKNQWPDRCVRFPIFSQEIKSAQGEHKHLAEAHINTPYHADVVPVDMLSPFTVCCWVRAYPSGDERERVFLSSGRFAFRCNRDKSIGFMLFDSVHAAEVELRSSKILNSKEQWHHVAGAFDGVIARLYVDGDLVDTVDYFENARGFATGHWRSMIEQERLRRDEEEKERAEASERARAESVEFFKSKAGEMHLTTSAKSLLARSESKVRLNKDRAKILGVKPMKTSEARTQAVDDWIRKRTADDLIRITEKNKEILQKWSAAEERRFAFAKERGFQPVRIGAGYASTNGPKSCFFGFIQHVACFDKALPQEAIAHQFWIATVPLKERADGYLQQALGAFDEAMAQCSDVPEVVQAYSQVISRHASSDVSKLDESGTHSEKSALRLRFFENNKNSKGVASLLLSLPDGISFSKIASRCWEVLKRLDNASYFSPMQAPQTRKQQLLAELERCPERFDLVQEFPKTAAEIYRFVLQAMPDFYGPDAGAVGWIAELETPSVVCYLILKLKHTLSELKRMEQFVKAVKNKAEMNAIFSSSSVQEFSEDKEEEDAAQEALQEARRECTKAIHYLDFSSISDISGKDLGCIARRQHILEGLNLSNCTLLHAKSLAEVAKRCKFLVELSLNGCQKHVDDGFVSSIAKSCSSLRSFEIRKCNAITDLALEELGQNCTYLRKIDFGECNAVTDKGLAALFEGVQSLIDVFLSWCVLLSDRSIEALVSMHKDLKRLVVRGCRRITDSALVAVATQALNVVELDLSFCNKIGDQGVLALTHNLIGLEKLNLSDLYMLTDRSFLFDEAGDGRASVNLKMLGSMTELILDDCKELTNEGVEEIFKRASSLSTLSLHGCEKIGDKVLQGEHLPGGLLSLDLSFCLTVTGEGVRALGERCSYLDSLKIAGCIQITDIDILMLTEACPGLQTISLSHCKDISDEAISSICKNLWIETLDISYCSRLTDSALDIITQHLTGLTYLNISHCRKFSGSAFLRFLSSASNRLDQVHINGCSKDLLKTCNQLDMRLRRVIHE